MASLVLLATVTTRPRPTSSNTLLIDGLGEQTTTVPPSSRMRLAAPIRAPIPAESTKGTAESSKTTSFLVGNKPATASRNCGALACSRLPSSLYYSSPGGREQGGIRKSARLVWEN